MLRINLAHKKGKKGRGEGMMEKRKRAGKEGRK
jgi:hypothetical protein